MVRVGSAKIREEAKMPSAKNVTVSFGSFEADLTTQELLKFGTRLRCIQALAILDESRMTDD
jgi:hypothetical protein